MPGFSATWIAAWTIVARVLLNFFLTSLGLAYLATHKPKAGSGVMDAVKSEQPVPGAAKKVAEPGKEPAKDAPKEPAKDAAASKAKEVPN